MYSGKHWIILLIFYINNLAYAQTAATYPNQTGDITYDEKLDGNFKPCDTARVYQYYNFGKGFQYQGEKIELEKRFKEKYKAVVSGKGETGYVTIRFVVNCEGKTGMFRIQEMGMDYQPKKFSESIVEQLLSITKSLDGWVLTEYEGMYLDFYQYLTFKLEDSRLTAILP